MELISYTLQIPKRDRERVFSIAPIGDIQWAGKSGPTAQETLKRHIARIVELDAWALGTGDFIDFMSPSNRARMSAAALYDTANEVVSDKASELTHEVYQEFLAPLNGKFAGLVEGHHFSVLTNGKTTDQLLAELLATRFLGSCAIIRLAFREDAAKMSSPGYDVSILVHHGQGGGQTVGAALNKLERWSLGFGGVDLIVMGHTTKMSTAPISRIYPVWSANGSLDHRAVRLVNAGGFSRSYVPHQKMGRTPRGLYPEVGMMAPAMLGAPIIRIYPRHEGGKWTREITVEV